MENRDALTIFRTIQKCRHQALHTNDCGNCEGCKYRLEQEQIDGAVALAISALKKQEEDRWHSIAKEGKPKESGTYIWTCDDGTHRKLVTVAKYFKRTGECILTGARSYWKAKAWKPLPEPYEEEKKQ